MGLVFLRNQESWGGVYGEARAGQEKVRGEPAARSYSAGSNRPIHHLSPSPGPESSSDGPRTRALDGGRRALLS
ncbi:unnamed protein product [Leuciscus chuanchicus]